MKLNRKSIVVLILVIGSLIITNFQVNGIQNSEKEISQNFEDETSILDDVSVEMITDLTSHREDKIPSILPDGTFTTQFNVTNFSNVDLNSLELTINTNDYGYVINPILSSVNSLNKNESWLTEQYIIDLITPSTAVSKTLDLAIILDQSGSMGDEISVLTEDLVGVINQISDDVPDLRTGLILFGGTSSNPYLDETLITPLTEDISEVVDVLERTDASGGHEPWGDALWVAQNWLDWREDAIKLIVLITDEPCDGGEIIGLGGSEDYDGELLYELFSNLSFEEFILCSVAASDSDGLTKKQLEIAADTTDGTYIVLGGDGPQTGDLPNIIGELIIKYAVEKDLKITINLSHLNHEDIRENKEIEFIVLIDDLPPEIDTWEYFSEDFFTDDKIVNIMFEIKDVTGVPFVEIYYKFSNVSYWTTTNATQITRDTFLLSLVYTEQEEFLYYKVYTEDWLGNEILTDVYTIGLDEALASSKIYIGMKKELVLIPYQQVTLSLFGLESEDTVGSGNGSLGIVFAETQIGLDVIVADIDDSIIIADLTNITLASFEIKPEHTVKISFIASQTVEIQIANVYNETLAFQEEIYRELGVDDAFLYFIDNRFNEERERSIVADSELVQTTILVFDAETWDLLLQGNSEVPLPNTTCYVLIIATYHYGEIYITFTYDDMYDPWGHYYNITEAAYWQIAGIIIGLVAIVGARRKIKK